MICSLTLALLEYVFWEFAKYVFLTIPVPYGFLFFYFFKNISTRKDYGIQSYSGLPNSRTVPNKRTGWEICQEIINEQVLINAQDINKTNMTYKVKKRTGWEIFLKLINAQCV